MSSGVINRYGWAMDERFFLAVAEMPEVSLAEKATWLDTRLSIAVETMERAIADFLEWNRDLPASALLLSKVKGLAPPEKYQEWSDLMAKHRPEEANSFVHDLADDLSGVLASELDGQEEAQGHGEAEEAGSPPVPPTSETASVQPGNVKPPGIWSRITPFLGAGLAFLVVGVLWARRHKTSNE